MVGYHFDANCILATLIRNRKGATIVDRWRTLYNNFKKVGVAPSIYILDNEVSKDLIKGFEEERIMYQLVMPYKHRNNSSRACNSNLQVLFQCSTGNGRPKFLSIRTGQTDSSSQSNTQPAPICKIQSQALGL